MMRTRTGDMSGPGVKLSRPEPAPRTNMPVRMPSVAPAVSTVMMTALAGKTSEPKTSAMRMNVVATM